MAFEAIIRAAKAFENGSWDLADALLKHADASLNGVRGLRSVAAELAENGLIYQPQWLQDLRRTAEMFPADRRHAGIGVRIHEAAGTPDMLDAIVKFAKTEGKPLNLHGVERMMTQIMREQKAERDKVVEDAEAEAEKAEKEEAEAKDEPARKKAKEKKRSAKKRAQKARGAPKRKALKPPKQEEISFLQIRTQFFADLGAVGKLIKRMNKVIEPALGNLTPAFCNAAIEECLSFANELRRLKDLIEKNRPTGKTRGHLHAVNQ